MNITKVLILHAKNIKKVQPSESMNRLATTRSDTRMQPRFSILNTYVNTTLDTLQLINNYFQSLIGLVIFCFQHYTVTNFIF